MAFEKNQIKSYTLSSTKKDVTKMFVALGGISGPVTSIDETDISLVSRITEDEVSIIVPRVNWSSNRKFEPYYFGSSGINTYCYNSTTDMVYLCVGKNQPTGLIGETEFGSTQQPAHILGIQTYSDGYSWLALYKIDFGLSTFLTENNLPVNTLQEYNNEITSVDYSTKYNFICDGGATAEGNCYFYYTQDGVDPNSNEVIFKDTLVPGIGTAGWICSSCHQTGDILGYRTVFSETNSVQSEIKRNPLTQLEEDIANNKLDVNNRYYVHYQNFKFVENLNKSIVSLHLDVSSLSIEDRILPNANPEIIVLDALGIGAKANITSYFDIRRNAFIANGINLTSGGSSYIDPLFSIVGMSNTNLEKAIKAVLLPDISSPSIFLPTPKISIIKKISSEDLQEIETEQKIFTKIAVVKNVKDKNTNIDAASVLQPNQKLLARTTTKIVLTANIGAVGSELPGLNEGAIFVSEPSAVNAKIITDSKLATSKDYYSKLTASKEEFDESNEPVSATLEISGVDELAQTVFIPKTSITVNSTNYTINQINSPNYKLDNIEFVLAKSQTAPIVFEETGSNSSVKISFVI